ncbi:hypothetical protein N9362_00070 [bacterium]|jgi:hypothetical protein|nr:hypothetical protein [bacterium]
MTQQIVKRINKYEWRFGQRAEAEAVLRVLAPSQNPNAAMGRSLLAVQAQCAGALADAAGCVHHP